MIQIGSWKESSSSTAVATMAVRARQTRRLPTVINVSCPDSCLETSLGRASKMSSKEEMTSPPSLLQMALADGTPKNAIFTALVVGTILTAINHGDVILSGLAPPPWKVILTYCVPYCVATWGRRSRANVRSGVDTSVLAARRSGEKSNETGGLLQSNQHHRS